MPASTRRCSSASSATVDPASSTSCPFASCRNIISAPVTRVAPAALASTFATSLAGAGAG
ncbi:hypothetical protein [Streptomyces sp. IBSNAI001]|uniref:hypothetical protein n=1 Tax=Streptomyces sp. IBSNAI001 TaxID=3457499 RepID=UPI003FD3DB86